MAKNVFILIIFLISIGTVNANKIKPSAHTNKISSQIIIDGIFDEEVWKNAMSVGNFTQHSPVNGGEASKKTEVRIVYDNTAIYVAASMYDDPKNIVTEMSKRDELANADIFVLTLIPFNDGMNGYQFWVSAGDVQMDEKINNSNGFEQLRSWDAVWESKARITDEGWVVEMKVPFSELRFPSEGNPIWGLNLWRRTHHLNEWNSYSWIDKSKSGILSQAGELHGINDVDPPLRLSFVPYLSNALKKNKENNSWNYKAGGGMDVKLGINESFTLDMMLIPDFTEVEPDDLILNLSTTETQFAEKRPFFTEGTELFSRGGIFYSKRIGKKPSEYDDVEDALDDGVYQSVKENPIEAKLINATKVSGRTNNGLGIGFFNAITNNTYAKVIDQNGIEEKILTDPLTNYNMLVIDQSLKNNSYLSFFNTNVWRKNDYVANVSGTEFRLENNKHTYSLTAKAVVSQLYDENDKNEFGHQLFLDFAKLNGNFRFNLVSHLISDTYDHNDMGYLSQNNRLEFRQEFQYNFYKPIWIFQEWYNSVSIGEAYQFNPRKFAGVSFDFASRAQFKNYWGFSINMFWTPAGFSDYFFLDVDNRRIRWTPWTGGRIQFNTDNRKKFSAAFTFAFGQNHEESIDRDQRHYRIEFQPKFRINHKIQIDYHFLYESDRYYKLVDNDDEDHIYVGQGHNPTFSNTITANYIFNNKSSLSFRLRHYWSRADYTDFYEVNLAGDPILDPDYDEDHNVNYNAFNMNLVYSWRFAPGSEISVIWKSAIDEEEEMIHTNSFTKNFRNMSKLPSSSSLSIKVLYYLDWQKLNKKSKS